MTPENTDLFITEPEINVYSAADWLKQTTLIHEALVSIEAIQPFGTAEHKDLFVAKARELNLL